MCCWAFVFMKMLEIPRSWPLFPGDNPLPAPIFLGFLFSFSYLLLHPPSPVSAIYQAPKTKVFTAYRSQKMADWTIPNKSNIRGSSFLFHLLSSCFLVNAPSSLPYPPLLYPGAYQPALEGTQYPDCLMILMWDKGRLGHGD